MIFEDLPRFAPGGHHVRHSSPLSGFEAGEVSPGVCVAGHGVMNCEFAHHPIPEDVPVGLHDGPLLGIGIAMGPDDSLDERVVGCRSDWAENSEAFGRQLSGMTRIEV